MDKDFLGNRYPGEIGYIHQEIVVSKDANRHNSVTCISDFENIDKEHIDLIKFIRLRPVPIHNSVRAITFGKL